ncbi:UNVERIFIED_CONTAM: Kinesin-like protein KIN-7D, chloroplastic [Sesamum calycinum]|uniref:Kinesin-like protein KIN-7D, chloroplastic n=1 Tax=Sesamum calycinum TaxID=2727403 RepID=A0AAW2RVA3_9LAMI
MASRQGLKSSKPSPKAVAAVTTNSPTSSTTSSSRQFLEPSIDGLSSPASSSARSKPQYSYSESVSLDVERSKENVTVTVRFRPLSPREIRQGEEIAWYADGDTIVRNEHNPSIAYAYDRVFGPTTTTRHVYDVAAQHVVNGAMEGINGTIFAYGVTSSGKTHTMHGDQRSPGIIPLAVKDAFSIIQETPSREFLLRVSYLEIYNEVVNDLLNPAGQNLRIREDAQGTFVEGVKEEVVLSPAHALSLIAAGEEHRHVGSTNFNLQSSRSHTIFTLTIESSPYGANSEGEAVTLSQLNLIDLQVLRARAGTTGLRRKEGSYINKSLLTLGTVIAKLTDGKSAHVPYRDSKLTRLLQSSLSGHGRVSLICTVTPSSSNSEETHNTLKFAHRAKHIEIQAAQNKIIDEKSLIKKYQNEIRCLKEELEQLKKGIVTVPHMKDSGDGGDILLLKQKLEDGQVRLQSRLEQEEEAKAALMGRIQRLTKLILCIYKSFTIIKISSSPRTEEKTFLWRRREEEILSWMMKYGHKRDGGLGTLASSSDKSSGVKSTSSPSTPQADSRNIHMEARHSHSLLETAPSADSLADVKHNKEVFEPQDNYLGQETPLSMDEIDLLKEQHKILSGEAALHMSALKRLSEEAAQNPEKDHIQVEMRHLREEIQNKNNQIASLGKQIADSVIPHGEKDKLEESQSVAEVMAQLNEKSFELEVKAADNRIIQEQLNQKILECEELQATIVSLRQQLSDAVAQRNFSPLTSHLQGFLETRNLHGGFQIGKESAVQKDSNDTSLLQAKASETEELRKKLAEVTESKEELELRNKKLAEESSYAKGLASAAAVELKALSEEVAKLMNHNERLAAELEAQKKLPAQRRTTIQSRNGRKDSYSKKHDPGVLSSEIKRELALSREREHSYEVALTERDQIEAELQRKVEESKQREAYLENELANMWILVAKLKRSQGVDADEFSTENGKTDDI